MSERSWEVTFRAQGNRTDAMTVSVPAPIARALKEQGLWKAVLTISENGLLYKPFRADRPGRGRARESEKIELPEWS